MEAVILEKYKLFCCLAGECPSTCCSGWRIAVGKKDVRRFQELDPEWLRRDILSNLFQREEQYYFKNREDGSCAMLDTDGLCRIQRNTSEETLCNTCRKYPRLIREGDTELYLSMAASCPVIARYLLQEEVFWLLSNESGEIQRVQAKDLGFVKDVWDLCQKQFAAAEELLEKATNQNVLYSCFEKMADEILNSMPVYQENGLSAKLLEALEKDCFVYLEDFIKEYEAVWERLVRNYLSYRIPSRRIEFPSEAVWDFLLWAQGELFLFRTLAFCRHVQNGTLSEEDFADLLQRVYRFCAHGKKSVDAFGRILSDFFKQNLLWTYVIL